MILSGRVGSYGCEAPVATVWYVRMVQNVFKAVNIKRLVPMHSELDVCLGLRDWFALDKRVAALHQVKLVEIDPRL